MGNLNPSFVAGMLRVTGSYVQLILWNIIPVQSGIRKWKAIQHGRGKWPSGLRCCDWIGRFPVQIPVGAQLGSGTQTCYQALGDLKVENW